MATPKSSINENWISIRWENANDEEIDVAWSSRTPRYSYNSPDENMEHFHTTNGNSFNIDTIGLNSGNYRFVIRKTNACGSAPWSQELTVACPQCHRAASNVEEAPEPWANFTPCNAEDPSSPCHFLL
jgi:hypothetical protein